MAIAQLIIAAVVVSLITNGWYLNEKLKLMHRRFDTLEAHLNGLREYLYEIDPQFDDERQARREMDEGAFLGGMEHHELLQRKRSEGKRTLNTSFYREDG